MKKYITNFLTELDLTLSAVSRNKLFRIFVIGFYFVCSISWFKDLPTFHGIFVFMLGWFSIGYVKNSDPLFTKSNQKLYSRRT